MRKQLILLIFFSLLLTFQISKAHAINDSIVVIVADGQVIESDVRSFLNSDGRVMVPVRFVSESLGARVEWTPNSNGTSGVIQIFMPNNDTIELTTLTPGWSLNDKYQGRLDTSPRMYYGRAFVPVRFVSEALGSTVEWRSNNFSQGNYGVVYIFSKGQNKETRERTINDPSLQQKVLADANRVVAMRDKEFAEIRRKSGLTDAQIRELAKYPAKYNNQPIELGTWIEREHRTTMIHGEYHEEFAKEHFEKLGAEVIKFITAPELLHDGGSRGILRVKFNRQNEYGLPIGKTFEAVVDLLGLEGYTLAPAYLVAEGKASANTPFFKSFTVTVLSEWKEVK